MVSIGPARTFFVVMREQSGDALGRIRTHNPLVRSQVLYPLSYEGGRNPSISITMQQMLVEIDPRRSLLPTRDAVLYLDCRQLSAKK
jgi:hypothetical protein